MNRIKELRQAKGWTKAELERRSGVNQRTIGSLENGASQVPTLPIGLRLAAALGVTPEELIGESPKFAISGLIEARAS